jgi:hypothetical protein
MTYTNEERETIKGKIAKLLALGNASKNDSEGQVMAALQKARELMDQYELDESDILKSQHEILDFELYIPNPKHTEGRYITMPPWVKIIATALRVYCDVDIVASRSYSPDKKSGMIRPWEVLRVIGRKDDVDLFVQMFKYIVDQLLSKGGLEDQAAVRYRKENPHLKWGAAVAVSFCNSYMNGMGSGLYSRMMIMHRERIGKENVNALVLSKNAKVKDYMAEHYGRLQHKRVGGSVSNGTAYRSGNSDSNSVALRPSITNKQRLIGR